MADTGTDDATNDRPVGRHTVGEHERQRDRIRETEGHDAALPVVPACVIELDVAPEKHLGGKLEVESALNQVSVTLGRIPVKGHQ